MSGLPPQAIGFWGMLFPWACCRPQDEEDPSRLPVADDSGLSNSEKDGLVSQLASLQLRCKQQEGTILALQAELDSATSELEGARLMNSDLSQQLQSASSELTELKASLAERVQRPLTAETSPPPSSKVVSKTSTSAASSPGYYTARSVYNEKNVDTTWSSVDSSFSPSPGSTRALSAPGSQKGSTTATAGQDLVQVTIVKATGLFGSSCKEMFVALKLGEERRVTSARAALETPAKGGSMVAWGQDFFIPCPSLRSSSLRVRLYTRKTMGRKVVVGEAHVHLLNLMDVDGHVMEGQWPLTGVVGQVELRIVWEAGNTVVPPLNLNDPTAA